jgi:cellulose synthase/poly-beta-1,6-N-acetylglucosamine synthase-like glycosyltransferase
VQTLHSLSKCIGFERLDIYVCGVLKEPNVLREVSELTSKFPNIRHLSVSYPIGDSSEKKNAGAREAKTDIVVFLDDDVVVAPDWPQKITAVFADPAVGICSGPSLVPPDVGLWARLAGLALASPAAGYVAFRYNSARAEPLQIKWSKIIGCNMAYRKTVWEQIKGFPADFWPGEEMIAAFRVQQAGHKLMFHPDAWVYHYPRQHWQKFWKQMHGYGATRIRLIRASVENEPTTLLPMFWVLSLILLIPLALAPLPAHLSILARGLLAMDLAIYGISVVLITIFMLRQPSRRAVDALLIFVIPVMHLAYGFGSWVEFFRPNKDLSEPAVTSATQ